MEEINQTKPTLTIVHIISGDRWAGAEVQAYTLMSELAKTHNVYAIVMNAGELSNRLEEIGISVKIFDESNHTFLRLLQKIRAYLNTVKPDIIHTHRIKEDILGSVANLYGCHAKCVRTVHGAQESRLTLLAKIKRFAHYICGRFLFDSHIAVSNTLKAELTRYYSSDKVVAILNGIDLSTLNLATDTENDEFNKYTNIGIVGRLDPVKRIDLFIGAAKKLATAHTNENMRFHIFGEGKLEQSLKEVSHRLNMNTKIIFHGHRLDIQYCISNMKAIVFCSDHEGTPMAALESMALGVPVIAHDVGGLSDILKDYPNLLVKEHTANGYATAIANELSNPTKGISLPQAYNSVQNVKAVEKLYKYILTNS